MRILLVGVERSETRFVARALREQAYAVDLAEGGEQALKLASEIDYDSILLDSGLPRFDGLQACRELRCWGVTSPVLMLASPSPLDQRVKWFEAGADGCLTKPFAVAELVARVRASVRRRYGKSQSLLNCADLELDQHRRRVDRGGVRISLTPREFAVLELLLLRSPDTVPRTEIMEHVWGAPPEANMNLVEVYVSRLRQKIDWGRSVKLIRTVPGAGYRLDDEPVRLAHSPARSRLGLVPTN
jgi:two-component system, OmpR family, copper resistance phosphate regulon response regulator CusR